jgi:peptidyl-prolyl cis-trans isomerase C
MKRTTLLLATAVAVLVTSFVHAETKAEAEKRAPKIAAPATEAAPALVIPDVVAVVDGFEIKKADVERRISAALAQQGFPLDALPPSERARLFRIVTEESVNERIIDKQSEGFAVDEKQVEAEFAQLKTRFGTEEALLAQIKQAGQTIDAVKTDIRQFYRKRGWMDKQLAGKPTPTVADAKEFFDKNPQMFQQPEEVKASHILFRVAEEASPEEVVAKEKSAKETLERVKKGEDFNKLAGELSEDPSAKQNSGDLGFFKNGMMVPEFNNAAFGMKVGEVSANPVRTKFGYHLIKVTDRRDAKQLTFDDAKGRLLEALVRRKREEQAQEMIKGFRESSKVEIRLPPAPPEPVLTPEPESAAPAPSK